MKESFTQALNDRILLFDGAMGTEIQKLDLRLASILTIWTASMMAWL